MKVLVTRRVIREIDQIIEAENTGAADSEINRIDPILFGDLVSTVCREAPADARLSTYRCEACGLQSLKEQWGAGRVTCPECDSVADSPMEKFVRAYDADLPIPYWPTGHGGNVRTWGPPSVAVSGDIWAQDAEAALPVGSVPSVVLDMERLAVGREGQVLVQMSSGWQWVDANWDESPTDPIR